MLSSILFSITVFLVENKHTRSHDKLIYSHTSTRWYGNFSMWCKCARVTKRWHDMFSDSKKAGFNNSGNRTKRIRRKERRHALKYRLSAKERETNETFLKYLTNYQIFDRQVSMLSKASNSFQCPWQTNVKLGNNCCKNLNNLHCFHWQNKEPHPFQVNSNWIPPVQPSNALESN